MKRLIVNGDDFGFSREVNAGIIRAHREGILTSTSLMVAEAARDEAAALAKENPALDVGLHLVVCMGRSVLPPARNRAGSRCARPLQQQSDAEPGCDISSRPAFATS